MSLSHQRQTLMRHPNTTAGADSSPSKVHSLDEVVGEKQGRARGVHPASILLDKDERELLKQGENVT